MSPIEFDNDAPFSALVKGAQRLHFEQPTMIRFPTEAMAGTRGPDQPAAPLETVVAGVEKRVSESLTHADANGDADPDWNTESNAPFRDEADSE